MITLVSFETDIKSMILILIQDSVEWWQAEDQNHNIFQFYFKFIQAIRICPSTSLVVIWLVVYDDTLALILRGLTSTISCYNISCSQWRHLQDRSFNSGTKVGRHQMNCFRNSVATSLPRVFTDNFSSLISLSMSCTSTKKEQGFNSLDFAHIYIKASDLL